MKIQLSKSETILLNDLIKTRNHFNQIYLHKSKDKEDPNHEKHEDHFNQESQTLDSLERKLKGIKCQLTRCQSEITASVEVWKDENRIGICETCAEILEIKNGETLPDNVSNRLLLYYTDMKV